MIALAVALIGAGVLAGAAFYTAANRQVPVVMVTGNVPAGAVITAGDLGTADISAGPGVHVIPANQAGQVVGQIAGTWLHPGMLLTASELTTLRPPRPGQVIVPLALKPAMLPSSGLAPGDDVLVVPTPGAQGQSGSSANSSLSVPVAGVVEAVSPGPDTDGYDVVDVLVGRGSGTAVAQQASTGQFALIVTKRGP